MTRSMWTESAFARESRFRLMHPRDPSERVARLHPFDENDWEMFAGCEADAPLVAYPSDRTAVVLDGSSVHVFDLSEAGPITSQRAEFANPEMARVAAVDLAVKLSQFDQPRN